MRQTAHPVNTPVAEPAAPPIECHPEVLETVRAAAVDGLMRLGRGGIEIGGLLFGRNTDGAIQILAVRPLECEHRFGPSFVLSENDETLLSRIVEPQNRDAETSELEPIGWYMSHGRRGYSLAESDVRMCDRYFAKPGSVTLIVMPEKLGPSRAGFFIRDANGALHTDVPSSEILLQPLPPTVPAPDTLRALQRSVAVIDEVPDHREVALNRLQTYLQGQEKHRRVSTWNLWATFALLLVCVIGGFYLWMKLHGTEAQAAIPLRVIGSGAQIRIEWDAKLDSVQKANAGLLEMRESDGTSVRVNVPPDALRAGSAIYTRKSDKVEIRLRLLYPNRPAFDSMVYFINPLTQQQAPAAKPVEAPPAVAEKTITPAEIPPSPIDERQAAKPPAARKFEPPKVVARTTPVPPPSVDLPNAPLPGDVGSSSPAAALKMPVAAAPAVPPPPPPRTPTKLRSGRLIWTGELAKNGLLSFSSNGPSAGSTSGRLPGIPVSVAVYPGTLVAGGIEVYVRDPNRATTAEPPSAQNGWNTTVFKYDAKKIPDIRVIEAPGAGNSWNQLVLQNGKRPISVLVVDWVENR
jgi:hypothetical protein